MFEKKYKSDLQSLSLAFKEREPLRGLEDNDELQSSKHDLDLFETDKKGINEENEIGGYAGSPFTGSRKNTIEEIKPKINVQENDFHESYPAKPMLLNARGFGDRENHIHEDITKTTLHDILSQTEEMKYPSLDKHYAESSRASDTINGKSGNGKRSKGRRQKRATIEEDKDSLKTSKRADAQESGNGFEASGQFDKQNETSSEKLKNITDSWKVQEIEAKGEPELPENDPLKIFLGTSGSGDGQSSGSGMALFKAPEQQLPPADEGSNIGILGSGDSREGPALLRKNPRQNPLKTTEETVQGEDKSGVKLIPIDPLLLLQVRKIRMNVLKAEKQATKELNDVRKDFRWKMEDLEEDLRMVKKLTQNVHKKVGVTVTDALAMARQAKTNATTRLYMARSK